MILESDGHEAACKYYESRIVVLKNISSEFVNHLNISEEIDAIYADITNKKLKQPPNLELLIQDYLMLYFPDQFRHPMRYLWQFALRTNTEKSRGSSTKKQHPNFSHRGSAQTLFRLLWSMRTQERDAQVWWPTSLQIPSFIPQQYPDQQVLEQHHYLPQLAPNSFNVPLEQLFPLQAFDQQCYLPYHGVVPSQDKAPLDAQVPQVEAPLQAQVRQVVSLDAQVPQLHAQVDQEAPLHDQLLEQPPAPTN
uniref:Uncharacterized protein n=1 Tax=Oryza glumipatula TaxID=40148 RepID=A0A0D9Z6E9_9ORYZ